MFLTALVAVAMMISVIPMAPAGASDLGVVETFDHRRAVTVTNEGDVLTGYEVRVVMDTAAEIAEGRMQSDCADVRFRAVLGLLDVPYYLEDGCNTESTLFWVRAPILFSGDNDLHVYFGNPKVESASDPGATFTVYQDFSDGEAGGWEAQGGAQILGVVDGALHVNTSGTRQAVLYTEATIDRKHRVEAMLNVAPGVNDGGYAGLGFLASDSDNTYISRSTSVSRIGLVDGGSYSGLIGGTLVTAGTFSLYEVSFDGATIHASIAGDAVSVSNSVHDSGHVGIASWWGLSGDHALDWILVRGDVDPEPTATLGDLEDCTLNLVCS